MANEYDEYESSAVINENSRVFALARARQSALAQETGAENENGGEEEADEILYAPRAARIGAFEAGILLSLAAFNDILDWFIIGSIPILGDILDGVVWGGIAAWASFRGVKRPPGAMFAGVIEFIPLGDLVPTFILQVAWIIVYHNRNSA